MLTQPPKTAALRLKTGRSPSIAPTVVRETAACQWTLPTLLNVTTTQTTRVREEEEEEGLAGLLLWMVVLGRQERGLKGSKCT